MEDLHLGRIAAFVPEFAVEDLPLGRALMMMLMNIRVPNLFITTEPLKPIKRSD